MGLWLKVGEILSSPLGSLVYHALLLLAVQAGLGMAWGEWKRARHSGARRLLVAFTGLIAARALYIAAGLIASAGWADPGVLLPPFERFADTASIALLGWAFMPPARRGARFWDLIIGANLLAAVGACIGFIIAWGHTSQIAGSALDYNLSWQALVWTWWQMGLILLASIAVVRNRGMDWGLFLLAMLVMFVGRPLQLVYPTIGYPSIPTWERLANLVAYPLVVLAVYQDIVFGLRVHSRELQNISQASLDQIKSLLFLFEASQQMSSSLDLKTVLGNAVRGIARALEADQCAIAFPEQSDPGVMRLVAIHNPARQGRGEGVTFPLEYQLMVQQAMRRKKTIISEEMDNVQLKVLFALLGSSEVGPVLVQPLVVEEEVIGTIIVGNSRSRRPFTPNEAKLCQSMADQVSGAIGNARRYQDVQNRIQELKKALSEERRIFQETEAQVQDLKDRAADGQAKMEELRRREELAREARNALEIRLVSTRAEAAGLAERLAVLESDLAQAHADGEAQLRWHEEELARRQIDWQDSSQTVEWTRAILQGMTAGVLVANVDGTIVEANVAAEVLLEKVGADLRGLPLVEVSDDDRWQHAVSTAMDGEAVRLMAQVENSTLLCDVAPLPTFETSQGILRGLVAVLQDISAETEEQGTRWDMLSAMADELRTPITTIGNYVDLLLSGAVGDLEDAQRKFLLRVKAGAGRMAQMADDLAREASGEERWASPQRQVVDVNRLIEVVVAGSHVHLEDKSLVLDMELPEDLPSIKADPDYLRRVLSNLLSNAYMASPEGGRIKVWATQSNNLVEQQGQPELNGDGFLIVSVKDFGGGLRDEALERVFDRARPSQTPSGLGESGAGLALVKMLVEAHGGRLWVESEYGVGTTFSFVLPASQREGFPVADRTLTENVGASTG